MEKNTTLTYTGENKMFVFENGQYRTTGNKVIADNKFVRVDGGNIQKGDVFVGSFNYQVENGVRKNTWLNIVDPAEETAIIGQINACFEALNTENE